LPCIASLRAKCKISFSCSACCARAKAWLNGKDFVGPEDIQDMAFDVLRHRVILSYEAEAEGISSDDFIQQLIARIAVP
jgi:MoxR-like ATPase